MTKTSAERNVPAIDPFDLHRVAMTSSPLAMAQDRISAVDAAMRGNYDLLRAKVAASLRPVVVVQFDFSGGTYNLLTDSQQITIQPVPRTFEQIKSICHCPLGIYTILAPYLEEPDIREWLEPLAAFGNTVNKALEAIAEAGFPDNVRAWSEAILSQSGDFISESVRNKMFSLKAYQHYTASVFDAIRGNMLHAAALQVSAVVQLLNQWKAMLGREWSNLYAVVLTTWTIEEKNQHWLVLRRLMDPKMLQERLYVVSVGSAAQNTVDVALMNLAIIVQDKIAGHLIFGHHSPLASQLNADLASRNDLLSSAVEKTIDDLLGIQQDS